MTRCDFRRPNLGRAGRSAALAMLLPVMVGCDGLFEVTSENLIEQDALDPVSDGTMFSRSALQGLATSLGNYIVFTAWFTNEGWVGARLPSYWEFGLRRVHHEWNNLLSSNVFTPVARAVAQGEQVVETLDGIAGQELNVARASLAAGYGLVLEASAFCEGTLPGPGNTPGPLMTPAQLLEAAVARFDKAIAAGGATTGTEATSIVTAARVGKGRALLQLGRRAEAAAAVSDVATNFAYSLPFVDEPSYRVTLGNGVFYWSVGGSVEGLVVPPHYRAMNDPRVAWADGGRTAQDGILRMYTQKKYAGWASPIRLASGLEARYIEVEARQNASEVLTFVNVRRAVGGQPAVSATNLAELMGHLMDQKSRDFWLEGHRLGDWRRNPSSVPNIPPTGSEYYKPDVRTIGDQVCLPLPYAEREANPNMKE